MSGCFVDRIDDGLSVRPDFIYIFIKIQNPSQRLLRRRDVVALRADDDNGRTNVAQVDGSAIGGFHAPRREIVADEQFVDDELNFLGVKADVSSPPPLELEVTRRFRVNV